MTKLRISIETTMKMCYIYIVMEISLWVLIKTVKPIFKSVHYMFSHS